MNPLHQSILEMASGYQKSQILFLVTKFGIPEILAVGEPKSSAEVAERVSGKGELVSRILRAAAAIGIIHRDPNSLKYSLNDFSKSLLDGPGSLKYAVLHIAEPPCVKAWIGLEKAIEDGTPGWDHELGVSAFQYYEKYPQSAEWFNKAMTTFSSAGNLGKRFVDTLDRSESKKTVVDVGGGQGAFMAQILRERPSWHGIVFDLESVVKAKSEYSDLASRIEFKEGNFFEKIPEGADIYTLKAVIHDWNDEKARDILINIRKVLPPNGKVVVIDRIIKEAGDPAASLLDIHMLACLAAKERNDAEFHHLFKSAGLHITRVTRLDPTPYAMVEGKISETA